MKIRFKRIHTVLCSVGISEEYWARESPFKRITLMSDRFFLTLCENTVNTFSVNECQRMHGIVYLLMISFDDIEC